MAAIEHLINGYSKQNGDSDLRKSIEHVRVPDGEDVIKNEESHIPEDYKKGTGTIPCFLVVVISGGEVRESHYLQELSKKHTFPRVKLVFVSSEKNKGGLPPKKMQDKLEDIVEFGEPIKSHKILYSSIDKIFMISDVDHYYDDLLELLPRCIDPKTTWIISNPCFEIWLYYAYYSSPSEEIKGLESIPRSKQSSTLKTINNTIVKGGIDPRKAFDFIQVANMNSKNNYAEDENGIPKLFCTNMYILGEYVLNTIGVHEFEKWLNEKQKKNMLLIAKTYI